MVDLKRLYNFDSIRSNLLTWLHVCYQHAELEPPTVLLAIQKSLQQPPTLSPTPLSPQRPTMHSFPRKLSPLAKKRSGMEEEDARTCTIPWQIHPPRTSS